MILVGVPVYNRVDLLRQALQSLVSQTCHDFCVVVVDDGSTEDIRSCCADYENSLKLYYHRQPTNKGAGATRNKILDYAQQLGCEFLVFMDSDDIMYPEALQLLHQKIASNDEYDIVYSNINQQVGDSIEVIKADKSLCWLHGKIYRTNFLWENSIGFPKLSTNEDLGFNLVAASYARRIGQIDNAFYYWREARNSLTRGDIDRYWKCISSDYISAIFFAFNRSKKLAESLQNSIIHCYERYQQILIAKQDTRRADNQLRRMFANQDMFVYTITSLKNKNFEFPQYDIYKDKIAFYPQTFGQWINQYVSQSIASKLLAETAGEES